MKSTFRSSLNRVKAKVLNNINDLRGCVVDAKRERNKKEYEVDTTDIPKNTQYHDAVSNLRTVKEQALAKHRRQIARASRRANRGIHKGQKQASRGH